MMRSQWVYKGSIQAAKMEIPDKAADPTGQHANPGSRKVKTLLDGRSTGIARVSSTVASAAAVIVLLSVHGGLSTEPSASVQRQEGGNAATRVPTCAPGATALEWFTDCAQAVGLDFVHFNGMSG